MTHAQNDVLPDCLRGCTKVSDCHDADEICDHSICKCKKRLCENSMAPNGVVQVDIDGKLGSTGTLLCNPDSQVVCNGEIHEQHLTSVPVVCTDVNPNPEWRTKEGGCVPECSKTNNQTKARAEDGKCSHGKYYAYAAGKCAARECPKPSKANTKNILSPSSNGHRLVIGTIIILVCEEGYVMYKTYSGNVPTKTTKLVCRYDELTQNVRFTPLDGSKEAHCSPGNI